jgi:DNA-binding NarL/FixJ family response regulator
MRATNVVLADAQPIFRAGVREVLEETGRYRVVAQADTGLEAIELSQRATVDLVVLGTNLSQLSGLQVARLLSQRQDAPRIVFLSNERDATTVAEVQRTGAAYLPRDTPAADLIQALDCIVTDAPEPAQASAEPELRHEPAHQARPTRTWPALSPAEPASDDRLQLLSQLEIQVLRRVAAGFSLPEIAASLATPVAVVEEHRAAILRKLGVSDPAQAVQHARRHGWLSVAATEFGSLPASTL